MSEVLDTSWDCIVAFPVDIDEYIWNSEKERKKTEKQFKTALGLSRILAWVEVGGMRGRGRDGG